ncbi:hypothetical protein Peur_014070 [Populus x canadensis]
MAPPNSLSKPLLQNRRGVIRNATIEEIEAEKSLIEEDAAEQIHPCWIRLRNGPNNMPLRFEMIGEEEARWTTTYGDAKGACSDDRFLSDQVCNLGFIGKGCHLWTELRWCSSRGSGTQFQRFVPTLQSKNRFLCARVSLILSSVEPRPINCGSCEFPLILE